MNTFSKPPKRKFIAISRGECFGSYFKAIFFRPAYIYSLNKQHCLHLLFVVVRVVHR